MKIVIYILLFATFSIALPIVRCKSNNIRSSSSSSSSKIQSSSSSISSSISSSSISSSSYNGKNNIRKSDTKLYSVTALNIKDSKSNNGLRAFPCGDELDQRIFTILLPAIVNFAILPLVGAADTFFVGGMRNALALAGQGAANQIFSSAFWIISFLPSIITPLVAKAAGSGDTAGVQQKIGEAMFLGTLMGILGMLLLTFGSDFVISLVLPSGAPARAYAEPYLAIRAITFIPALLSTVGFAAFRGTMDVVTPLKISLLSNIVNVLLDPFLIFKCGMGVAGAAAATCVSEIVSFFLYMRQLASKNMLNISKMFKVPSWESLKPMLLGGLGVQMRAVALNIAFLSVTRTTQALDTTGTAAAAHSITIQLWQLGGVVLLALSTCASIIVPREIAKAQKEKVGLAGARNAANRLLLWGLILGLTLGGLQLGALPLLKAFSPLPEVQQAARLPSIIGATLQIINGIVFVGEGIQQGNQYFGSLAACTAIAATGMITYLKYYGTSLVGVWASFAIFNLVRLCGVLYHHFHHGPLAPSKINYKNE